MALYAFAGLARSRETGAVVREAGAQQGIAADELSAAPILPAASLLLK